MINTHYFHVFARTNVYLPLFTEMPRRCLLGNPLGPKDKKEGQGISTHSLALPLSPGVLLSIFADQEVDVGATGHQVS
jgi:hypothetical protein